MDILQRNSVRGVLAIVAILILAASSRAAVVYDESVNGDFNTIFSPTPIVTPFNIGTNSVIGTLLGSTATPKDTTDWFTFVIGPGTQLTNFVLADWQQASNVLPVFFIDGLTATFVNQSNVGLDLLPLLGGGPVGPGTYLVGATTGSISVPGYQYDFAVTSVSAVPLPAALPLFLAALSGLGFFGWRRKKQAAVAA